MCWPGAQSQQNQREAATRNDLYQLSLPETDLHPNIGLEYVRCLSNLKLYATRDRFHSMGREINSVKTRAKPEK